MKFSTTFSALFLISAAALTGCNSDRTEDMATPTQTQTQTQTRLHPAIAAAKVVDDEPFIDPDSGASPPLHDKSAILRAAVRGLSFDTDRVVVESGQRDAPARAEQFYNDGLDQYAANHAFEAITAMRKAIQRDVDNPACYQGLAKTLHMRGRTEWAIASLQTALDLAPDFTQAQQDLANALWMNMQADEAIELMTTVVEKQPDNVEAHERLAVWHRYFGRYDQAWSHVHAVQELGHEMPPQFMALLEREAPDPADVGN